MAETTIVLRSRLILRTMDAPFVRPAKRPSRKRSSGVNDGVYISRGYIPDT